MNLLTLIKPVVRKIERGFVRNAPHILMGMGTFSGIMAVVLAAEATPEAIAAIREEEFNRRGAFVEEDGHKVIEIVELTAKEKFKLCWKYYIPSGVMELISLTCFWGAHGIDIRRQAVLAGLCTTAEEALHEYQRKVKEMLGTDTEKDIRKGCAQDFIDKNPPPQMTVYMDSDTERDMIFEGQYFRSSYYNVKNAELDANHEMIQNMYISESELMWLLDPEKKYLKPKPESGQVGWCVDNLLKLDIEWGEGPKHQPVGYITVRDKNDDPYPAEPGFSRML